MADKLRDGTSQAGERHGQVKLTDEQVAEIRTRYAAGDVLQKVLAAEYGIVRPTVSQIVRRRRRKVLTATVVTNTITGKGVS